MWHKVGNAFAWTLVLVAIAAPVVTMLGSREGPSQPVGEWLVAITFTVGAALIATGVFAFISVRRRRATTEGSRPAGGDDSVAAGIHDQVVDPAAPSARDQAR